MRRKDAQTASEEATTGQVMHVLPRFITGPVGITLHSRLVFATRRIPTIKRLLVFAVNRIPSFPKYFFTLSFTEMSETLLFKILAQLSPGAATPEVLYTAPSQGRTNIRSVFICNRNAATGIFRFAVVPLGSTLSNQHYLFFDQAVNGNTSYNGDVPMYLNGGDYISIYASTADFSFTLFGNET